jgi:hypothetical protein
MKEVITCIVVDVPVLRCDTRGYMRWTMLLVLSLVLVIAPQLLYAQPEADWARKYGGIYADVGYAIIQATSGEYVVVGTTESYGAGEADVYFITIDSEGDTIWTRTYGGPLDDSGHALKETDDGFYISVGSTESFGAGGSDVYLVKINSDGDSIWARTYGGEFSDWGESVIQTKDGNYLIAGGTESFGAGEADVYLLKVDPNGDTIWTRTYGGNKWDEGYDVAETRDGGYIIAGWTKTYGEGGFDVYLVKTDCNGVACWAKTFGGQQWDWAKAVVQIYDGGYVVAGGTGSCGAGLYDIYMMRTDSTGEGIWTKPIGGIYNDSGHSLVVTPDGGYLIVGETESYGTGKIDIYLLRTDSNGATLWEMPYGGTQEEAGYSVVTTDDGGFIVAGYTETSTAGMSDVYVVKFAGLPYLDLINAQTWVPRGATLDFQAVYENCTDNTFIVEVAFEAYLPSGSDPKKTFTNILTVDPGSFTKSYSPALPKKVPKDEGYLWKAKMIYPVGSGEVISQDRFEFEVGPPMFGMP